MHSYLVDHLELPDHPDTLKIFPDTSIGIAEIKQIIAFLLKKPLSATHNTVVVYSAHLLTLPAQNALLKTLEEPPGQAQIYLVTPHPDQLLPTILSRCSQLPGRSKAAAETPSPAAVIELLSLSGLKDRLKFLESQKLNRESTLDLIRAGEIHLHSCLRSEPGSQLIRRFRILTRARKYLLANCSVKLINIYLAANL